MKTIVVASDSFKGSLSSAEVAAYIGAGIHKVFPDCNVKCVTVADGGEGTAKAIVENLNGSFTDVFTVDPLGRSIVAQYGLVEENCCLVAVIEMAAASGLPLLVENERNPMETSTYGTGLLVKDAMLRGCRKVLMCIGGSATNDGGTGMLSALGFRFLDAGGEVLEGKGSSLGKISYIDDSGVLPEVFETDFLVACDVSAPFCGPDGAAYVFAKQKGADSEIVEVLDRGLRSFSMVAYEYSGIDLSALPGAGAAGGLGGGMKAFLNATLLPGADMVLDAVRFDEIISGADLVVTGEGRIDTQTLMGKIPFAISKRAASVSVPVIAVGGSVDVSNMEELGFSAAFPVVSGPVSLSSAMQPEEAGKNIVRTISQIMALLKLGGRLF